MRWRNLRRSGNIRDARGRQLSRTRLPGGLGRSGMRIPVGRKGGLGFGTIIIIGIVMLLFGVNPLDFLAGGGGMQSPALQQASSYAPSAEEERLFEFSAAVLGSTEDVWSALFAAAGESYAAPTMEVFSGATQSACGFASSASGPFYCPGDQDIYLDLSFFDELHRRFGAPGDFAQAYVIAHEVGHHVQTLLGISSEVRAAQANARSDAERNALQVRMELQADCLAGVWAHHADAAASILESGDVEEALGAASAIGDDRLQRQAQGYVVPDAFTHGSSAQRMRWFKTGLNSGDFNRCNTFEAREL